MKFKTLLFSLAGLASLSLACFANPVQAADEGGMRWKFAPHTYKLETPTGPGAGHYSGPVPTAHHGSVPKGSSFLGIDPGMLQPRPRAQAPVVQPMVAARPLPQPSFNNAFGKPMAPAALPATAMSLPMSKPAVAQRSTSNLSGRVRPRRAAGPSIARAHSMPVAQSYGSGYQPGNTAPTSGGWGGSASTAVSGVVKRK